MITTAYDEFAARLRKLRQHAMTVWDLARHSSSQAVMESWDEVGSNYRMTDLQAAIGLVRLERLDEMLAGLRLASRCSQRFSQFDWLVPPLESADCRHNFQSYMVRLKRNAPKLGTDSCKNYSTAEFRPAEVSSRFTGNRPTATKSGIVDYLKQM